MNQTIPKTTQYAIGGVVVAGVAFVVTGWLLANGQPWVAVGALLLSITLVALWGQSEEGV